MEEKACKHLKKFPRLNPDGIQENVSVADLIDQTFLAYNAGRMREGCQLVTRKMLPGNGLVGMSLTGALTPAGLGRNAIIPLIQNGYVDWIIATGANLYHDLHFGLDLHLHSGSPFLDDIKLRDKGLIRIYDVLFDYDVLLDTDAFVRQAIQAPEFQSAMGTDEFHYKLGRYVHEREKQMGLATQSVLSAAYQAAVPVFTSSPGDSSIGMNVAAMALRDSKFAFDVTRDVNQTASIVHWAKINKLNSSVILVGGGSPKNFMLQTEPQIQEVMGIPETGHDYFFQMTDARPDTGGLSGATPSEAVSWGKVNPENLPDCVVAYLDATVGLPILTAYCLSRAAKRPGKRLYEKRDETLEILRAAYFKHGTVEKIQRPQH